MIVERMLGAHAKIIDKNAFWAIFLSLDFLKFLSFRSCVFFKSQPEVFTCHPVPHLYLLKNLIHKNTTRLV